MSKITREQFVDQYKPCFGKTNPERMRVDFWEYMVRTRSSPYPIRRDLVGSNECTPTWNIVRFGMSTTPMPDGRLICIAGEHEDFYDPDFCIYNDVIVLRPTPGQSWVNESTGTIEIYGYPEEVFPPTDFHSATLVGDAIYVIGSLGYQSSRTPGFTPVQRLDTNSYSMTTVQTRGTPPGWVSNHHASYDAARHAITVRGGQTLSALNQRLENHRAAYRLRLEDQTWELLAAHEKYRKYMITYPEQLQHESEEICRRCTFTYPYTISNDHDVRSFVSIDVFGVHVRLGFEFHAVELDVEGELQPDQLEAMLAEVQNTFENACGMRIVIKEVPTDE